MYFDYFLTESKNNTTSSPTKQANQNTDKHTFWPNTLWVICRQWQTDWQDSQVGAFKYERWPSFRTRRSNAQNVQEAKVGQCVCCTGKVSSSSPSLCVLVCVCVCVCVISTLTMRMQNRENVAQNQPKVQEGEENWTVTVALTQIKTLKTRREGKAINNNNNSSSSFSRGCQNNRGLLKSVAKNQRQNLERFWEASTEREGKANSRLNNSCWTLLFQ